MTPVCPRCRGPMTLKKSSHGPFYACRNYPTCRGTVDAGGATVGDRAPPPPPPLGVPGGAERLYGVAPGSSEDPHQQAVIDWREGWAVVAAAAGSGKTHTVIQRTLALLSSGEIPESILLLAYNTSAAELLRSRLAERAGSGARRVQAMTFHAWCYALLRNWYPQDRRFLHGHLIGGRDGPHPVKLALQVAETVNRDRKHNVEFGAGLKAYERWAESLLPLDEDSVALATGCADPEGITAFLREFLASKRRHDLIDFTDMLVEVAKAISYQPHAEHVAALTRMYRHVVVDEAQDLSLPRAIVAQWLGQNARSFLAVGDLRQGINSFSGSKPEIFTDLATAPGVTLLVLPVNRRSTQRIVEASNEIARDRDWNLGGECSARPDAPRGEIVQTWETKNGSEEAAQVISDIQRRISGGLPLETPTGASYACLARTNAMLVDLECAFVARNIPVRVAGSSGGIWGSSVGQEMLAYLEGTEGVPTFSLLNVLNKPTRYGKKRDLGDAIEQAVAREKAGQPAELLESLQRSVSKPLARFGADLRRAASQKWATRCLTVARWLGLDDDDEEEAGEDRKAALEALMHLAQHLGSLKAVHDYKQEALRGEREPAVVLSTIHSAKGREWNVVYTCGACVGKLPHKRSTSEAEVEEERRLFYVAVTRARDVAIVSTGGCPSRFLVDVGWVEDVLRSSSTVPVRAG